MKKQLRTRGFSLVEMLVYLAVTVFVSTAGVLTYLSLNTVFLRYETERSVNHSAQVALERISHELRGANTVNTSLSTLGTSSSTLALTQGATSTQFSLNGDSLMYTQNGVQRGALTSEDVSVVGFVAHHYVGTTTELVRVSLTLHAANNAASTTRTYYTSAVLRGSYE